MAGVGSWFAADRAVKQFEMQTDAEVNEALNAGGMNWARVRSNGLRVDLTGVAPTEIERFRALEIMAQIVDTDRIR
ncbi:MAG: OmpA family protein, partial [Pseudomonadota bacterium]